MKVMKIVIGLIGLLVGCTNKISHRGVPLRYFNMIAKYNYYYKEDTNTCE